MTDLLTLAIDAHGGWERWKRLTKLSADVSIGGGLWHMKGWPDALADTRVVIDPHSERVEYAPFILPGQRGRFELGRTAILSDGGVVLAERSNPRRTFDGDTLTSPWGSQQLLYFSGYAIWTYLTSPFLFRYAGFESEEIEPWVDQTEIWRRLKVRFPASVESHSTEQMFYFDSSNLLRRHDYSVDIIGGTASANYASDHKTFGGFVFPTKRRVYAIGPDNRPILDRVAVSIDIKSIELE